MGEQGASRWIADRKGSVGCAGPRELSSKRVDGPLGRSAGSGAEYRTVPCQGAAAAAALRSGRTLVMSFVGSVIRRKRKITTPKTHQKQDPIGASRVFFFFFQLCDVLVLVIIHKRN